MAITVVLEGSLTVEPLEGEIDKQMVIYHEASDTQYLINLGEESKFVGGDLQMTNSDLKARNEEKTKKAIEAANAG